jgi:hypothetical protein
VGTSIKVREAARGWPRLAALVIVRVAVAIEASRSWEFSCAVEAAVMTSAASAC